MKTEAILDEKFQRCKDLLSALQKVAVAFSGGVDSTFLLKTAREVLGEHAIAVTACSEFVPPREIKESQAFCEKEGIRQILCPVDALAVEGISQNPKDRCYICKKALMGQLKQKAEAAGMFLLAEGSNMDDLGDYRPGLKAVEELGIRSPLKEAGLTKREIRELSRQMGLPTWDKPSFACLASRFAYGETITKEKLSMVDQAEQILMDHGFSQMRVRVRKDTARIELLPDESARIFEERIRKEVSEEFTALGFTYVSVDLRGYRTGSMNEGL
ncbi:MAG TPA: ATP-dependent sacrificial sulfur transferase LarE [Lachnospiraceae bacterium]|nr:ATP-dependent sacrificial sulfur transferase LarE [Lachnospiraceae bacterium]